jgi:hypothetical protein
MASQSIKLDYLLSFILPLHTILSPSIFAKINSRLSFPVTHSCFYTLWILAASFVHLWISGLFIDDASYVVTLIIQLIDRLLYYVCHDVLCELTFDTRIKSQSINNL